MAIYKIMNFRAAAPSLHPRLLKEEVASYAENVYTDNGTLRPVYENKFIYQAPVGTKSFFRYTDVPYWFTFPQENVHVVEGLIPNDVSDYVYYTGVGYPRIARNDVAIGVSPPYPEVSYRLGIPRPDDKPTVSAPSGTPDEDAEPQVVVYVYTFVDAWGSEGAESTPSDSVTLTDGESVTVTMGATPTGNYNLGSGALRRIYRSNIGTAATAFQFCGEVPIAQTTFVDDNRSADLNEVLVSGSWIGPPDDDTALYPNGPLKGLTVLPYGSLIGYVGNEVSISEPYLPHAWPLANRYTTAYPVKGIVVTAAGVVIGTEGKPYILQGNSPAGSSLVQLDINQACVSERSMVDMGEYALYATPDGLVAAAGNEVQVITEGLITREQWQKFKPESIHAYVHNSQYIGFYDNGEKQAGFVLDPRNIEEVLFREIDFYATFGWRHLETDILYLLVGENIVAYEEDETIIRTATWRSKQWVMERPTNLSSLQIDAAGYPLQVKIICDGVEEANILVEDSNIHRLPGGFRARTYQVEVVTDFEVYQVQLGSSSTEIANN